MHGCGEQLCTLPKGWSQDKGFAPCVYNSRAHGHQRLLLQVSVSPVCRYNVCCLRMHALKASWGTRGKVLRPKNTPVLAVSADWRCNKMQKVLRPHYLLCYTWSPGPFCTPDQQCFLHTCCHPLAVTYPHLIHQPQAMNKQKGTCFNGPTWEQSHGALSTVEPGLANAVWFPR